MDFFQNTCFKESYNMTAGGNLKVKTNFYIKQWLSVIKWNKKHSSKHVVCRTCTLEEKFLVTATFEGLWVVSFETE